MTTSTPIPITIIGAGIISLSIAYHLTHSPSHKGKYAITIIARDLPGDMNTNWASPWAGAIFQPQPTLSILHQKMQTTSYTFYSALSSLHPSTTTGIKSYPTTEYYDASSLTSSTPSPSNSWIRNLMPDFKILSDLPSKREGMEIISGISYTSLAINPTIFLPWLKQEIDLQGVKFIRKAVTSIQEVRSLSFSSGSEKSSVIINATGVGARELACDATVTSIRGQTLFVKSDFEQLIMCEGSAYTYIIPRPGSGGVILGGVKSTTSKDLLPDGETRKDILRRCNLVSGGAFGGVDLNEDVVDIVGFRPGRVGGMRVEREGEDVIHAYGVAGAGYIYSFGVAERVGELVDEVLRCDR